MNQETRPAPPGFSEQQLHTLFELVSDGIWAWNANTGALRRRAVKALNAETAEILTHVNTRLVELHALPGHE